MSGTTPVGSLDLTANHLEAVMHLQIQAATFATPVSFSLIRIDPVALVPESGLDASGSPATIDPIAAYQFTFAVPTLDRDAALSFDIVVARLDAATRTALLDSLAAGTATLPRTGTFYVTVSELLLGTGKFSGAYCVSLESSQNAWRTFKKR